MSDVEPDEVLLSEVTFLFFLRLPHRQLRGEEGEFGGEVINGVEAEGAHGAGLTAEEVDFEVVDLVVEKESLTVFEAKAGGVVGGEKFGGGFLSLASGDDLNLGGSEAEDVFI